MFHNEKIAEATGTISQRFLMLIQAMSGIRGLTSIAINEFEETDLLDKALAVLIQNIDFERSSIFLLNNDNELYCAAGMDWDDRMQKSTTGKKDSHIFKLGQGILGRAAETKKIYYCQNCLQDENYLSFINSQVGKNVGSIICIPLLIGEELLGVLNVSHPESFFFHPWQEHVLSIHANIIAQMLYNHRLMKDMATQVNSRTQELQNSLEETETLKTKYQALSVIDDLTQIYNRRYFFSEVPSALARAIRYKQPLSVLFIDLDYFKSINDNYGHEVGDDVLKDVAFVLSNQSRKGDILARMGGEEFAMVIPNTDIDGIQLLAERTKESVSGLKWTRQGESFGVTLSMGISEFKSPGNLDQSSLTHINEIVHILVREADQALYHSKNTGRDKITLYRNLPTEPSKPLKINNRLI